MQEKITDAMLQEHAFTWTSLHARVWKVMEWHLPLLEIQPLTVLPPLLC